MRRYLEKIITAPVYDVAIETPLEFMPRLSNRLNHTVLCKREDLQPVFSFKNRGAYNKMYHLAADARAHGVICASAGNHAQGVALAARKLGISATIVMPTTTPQIKIDAVRHLGERWVKIILHGDFYDEAAQHAQHIMQTNALTYIPPFDDEHVIAGQGTIGLEILRQRTQPIDAIFVPVGGGGLMAGIALLVKTLRPDIRIIGVEPVDAASMTHAIQQGKRESLPHVGIFAEGVAVKQPGALTYPIIQQYADDFVTVTTDEICAAIKDIFDDLRAITEPSGALATAGLKKWITQQTAKPEQTLIAILSGANINFDRLRYIAERAEIGEHREGLLAVTIPEQPGAFLKFCQLIGNARAITEFNYRYQDVTQAQIFVGVQLDNRIQLESLIKQLRSSNYPTENLTDNEMAKEHLRYMIGGRPATPHAEYLFSFGFPERPGALLHFLTTLGTMFNISLFHYRNHGSDYGRVLCGIQTNDYTALQAHIKRIGYDFHEETDNIAYHRFLSYTYPPNQTTN